MSAPPLVFWLALISLGNYNAGTVTISPVPFSTLEGCELAAEEFTADQGSRVGVVCYPQRKDDVLTFQSWGFGRRWDYTP